ncbi:hypothetical protein EDC01DRAFT_614218 [Geopyxis carbonaria]|nr:hypothetical protein EDC01DRAFT_614218 [Geopyxis carbonaria]
MSLQKTYQRFIASPNAFALTENASLHYITSGKSVDSRDSILSHLTRERKQMKKRVEKVISSVETADSLVLEIETEIEIITNGGNFLPGLDENFLVDQVIVFPIIHFVNFQDGLITQARLFWDQSTCLKQLGVIGRTGRNWPIIEGRQQCNLIQKSVSEPASSSSVFVQSERKATNGNGASSPKRPGSNGSTTSTTSHISRDPHASLSLFGGSDQGSEYERPIAPRASSSYRPPSRNLTAIVGTPDNVDEERTKHPRGKARSSFSKEQTYHVGENGDDEQETPKAVEKKVHNVNPKKYNHFEFGDGEDATQSHIGAKPKPLNPKNRPSWDFEDFVTPEKKPLRSRPDDVRHFGWSEDDAGVTPSPVKQPRKMVSHKNIETHFSMKDVPDTPPNALGNVTNKPVRPDAVSQFEIADNSPSGPAQKKKEYHPTTKAVANSMKSNWDPSDKIDPDAFFGRMGAEVQVRGIHISGNGRGNRKETDNHWGHGDNSPKTNVPGKTAGRSVASKKPAESSGGGFWDY